MASDESEKAQSQEHGSSRPGISKTSVTGLVIAVVGFLMFAMSGFGYNWNLWELGPAIDLFLWGAVVATAGALLGIGAMFIVKLREKRGMNLAITGIVVGLIATGTFLYFYTLAVNNPPIHDITTDFENPPQFQSLIEVRKEFPNQSEYGGSDVARQQKNWFPNIGPLELQMSPDDAFPLALQAANNMNWWKIQATHPDEHIIEATETIPWFGFKDDVVIRVSGTESGSRIDVRSVSRIGKGDLGANARRVQDYLAEVRNVVRGE